MSRLRRRSASQVPVHSRPGRRHRALVGRVLRGDVRPPLPGATRMTPRNDVLSSRVWNHRSTDVLGFESEDAEPTTKARSDASRFAVEAARRRPSTDVRRSRLRRALAALGADVPAPPSAMRRPVRHSRRGARRRAGGMRRSHRASAPRRVERRIQPAGAMHVVPRSQDGAPRRRIRPPYGRDNGARG